MRGVIVGEGHTDHEDDRQDREDEDARDRQGEQGLVEVLVEQRGEILLVRGQALAELQALLGLAVLLDVDAPEVDQRGDDDDGEQTVEQDQEAVVAVDGLAALLVGLYGAEGEELAQVPPAEIQDIEQNAALEAEHREAAHDLSACELAEAHDQEGEPGRPAALGEGQPDLLEILAQPAEEARDHFSFSPQTENLRAIPSAGEGA